MILELDLGRGGGGAASTGIVQYVLVRLGNSIHDIYK